jgi:hypothetical protein
MLRSAILTVTILATAPVMAQTTPAPAPAPPTAATNAKVNPLDKIVCRTEDTLGSRLKAHKVCATVREWKDQEDDNRAEMDRIRQTQGTGMPSG